ncbi:hypothetical protein ELQ35_08070 [Peribacillus cavernae]|uniref:DUF4181 domain-containing protein n=1 Tax=Peribacillus cavernae TaxID=1674310 RepID=A0A433HPP7_9BACI|nr:hypothetical protein [Peribacillus cavernae]MDQ0217246.1 hypothetical protein [Peribacillus cavernae]RUQ30285.1 hypothetical protein ELQ35_08070 [Peribacillus cavernae]
MKNYIVFLFQIIVWSGYTVVEWLSAHDRLLFKVLMFLIFCYLAVFIGKSILKSNKRTVLVTCTSLMSYAVIELFLNTFLPH